MADRRQPTSTSAFGVGRRENHDATAFYDRFPAPVLSDEKEIARSRKFVEPGIILGDAREMTNVDDNSVALVVTSPPYFAGKEYEEHLGRDGVPASYLEYLEMLHEVFAECVRTLEPGGRIAVNVANLGRRPYRSLSADVIGILQDELRLLLRGEVIWKKGEGATGNIAWGSYLRPSNPVLRDLTERVIIASKGRFDRALNPKEREAEGLPYRRGWPEGLSANEFAEATLDVWEIDSESARRVGHPAPFPVALPKRLINLYTYRDDLVLDPFMGSGTTLVAAIEGGRRTVGYDVDPGYVERARHRVAEVGWPVKEPGSPVGPPAVRPAGPDGSSSNPALGVRQRSTHEGKMAQAYGKELLVSAGFSFVAEKVRLRHSGATFNLLMEDRLGGRWYVDVSGAFTVTSRAGLRRTDTVWKTLGRAHAFCCDPEGGAKARLLLVTSHLPERGDGWKALKAAGCGTFWDAIQMDSDPDWQRLVAYATGEEDRPLPGFWSGQDLASLP